MTLSLLTSLFSCKVEGTIYFVGTMIDFTNGSSLYFVFIVFVSLRLNCDVKRIFNLFISCNRILLFAYTKVGAKERFM